MLPPTIPQKGLNLAGRFFEATVQNADLPYMPELRCKNTWDYVPAWWLSSVHAPASRQHAVSDSAWKKTLYSTGWQLQFVLNFVPDGQSLWLAAGSTHTKATQKIRDDTFSWVIVFKKYFYVYMCLACMYACVSCACSAYESQQRALALLEPSVSYSPQRQRLLPLTGTVKSCLPVSCTQVRSWD